MIKSKLFLTRTELQEIRDVMRQSRRYVRGLTIRADPPSKYETEGFRRINVCANRLDAAIQRIEAELNARETNQ